MTAEGTISIPFNLAVAPIVGLLIGLILGDLGLTFSISGALPG